jgi:hypothetical protein
MQISSYCRARITAIRKLIESLPACRDEKNPDRVLVRNGYIPDSVKEEYDKLLKEEYLLTFSMNEPLTFTETTSFNTWFEMYPEKVCGKEYVSTSREFPVMVNGTKEDIVNTIRKDIEATKMESFNTKDNFIETKNRFGKPLDIPGLTVSDFEDNYYNCYQRFQEIQKPLQEKYDELKKQLKEAGRDKTKRKEINEKMNELAGKLSQNHAEFDNDWMEYITVLRNIIIVKARQKGLPVIDENESCYADDILLAITERPGREYYWNTRISDVIEKELEYFVEKEKPENSNPDNNLELEALALETELKLINL